MPLNVGDAVLSFVGDTTNLDVVLSRILADTDKTMSAAAGSVGTLTGSVDELGVAIDKNRSDVDKWNEELMRSGGAVDQARASVDALGTGFSGFNKVVDVNREQWDGLTPVIKRTFDTMAVGQNGAVRLGEVMNLAGEKSRESMYQARGEAQLLGEEFGIRLPRHVRSFLAELPGVGTALSAAFSATAVFFLIEALVKGSEKLSNWVANTFIFTQAMKDSDQAVKDQNKTLLELADRIAKDDEALSKFGKTQAELKWDKVEKLTEELKKNDAAFQAASKAAAGYATAVHLSKPEEAAEQLGKLNSVLGAVAGAYAKIAVEEKEVFDSIIAFFTGGKSPSVLAEEARKAGLAAQATIIETGLKHKAIKKEITEADREALAQSTMDQEAAANRSIAIDESLGMSKIKRWAALAIYEASFSRDSSDTILRIHQDAAEQEYQIKLQTLQKERLAEEQAVRGLQGSGDIEKANKQIALIQSTNTKIEALNAEHYVKEKQMAVQSDEALLKLRADWAVAAISLAQGLFPNLPEDTRNVLSMADAAARLGVVLSGDLKKSAADAKDALKVLDMEYKAGQISLRDLQQAQMAAMATQIAYDKEMGVAPKIVQAEQTALDKLTKSFDAAYGPKARGVFDTFFADFKKKAKETDTAAQQMGQIVGNAAFQMQRAFESAMASAILSQTSFGAALEKATAQVLAQLSAQAAVQSIYSLALGFLKAAQYDYVAADLAFTAAAEFGILAVATGAAAYGINSAAGGGGGSSQNSASSSSNPGGASQSSSSGGGSNQTVSVTHLAAGGIVSRRTMIGDSSSGGDAEEAIIPLTDPAALARIANALLSPSTLRAAALASSDPAAIAASSNKSQGGFDDAAMAKLGDLIGAHLDASGGAGDTHNHHYHIKGLLDSGTLVKTMGKMNKIVLQNRATLHASNSLRVTRRSQ